jgi:hypothetical protein
MTINYSKLLNFLLLIIAGIFLCFYAFYNQFPLVFSDTGSYINSGFENIIPNDRPVFYGLFIRHISLHSSLWLVVLMQGIIVSFIIYKTIEFFCSRHNRNFIFIITIFFLILFTGISFDVSRLIPDIFTPVSFLCLLLLLLNNTLSKKSFIIIAILYIFTICVHSSHIPLNLSLLTAISIFILYRKIRKKSMLFTLPRVIICWSIFTFSLLLISFTNYALSKNFRLTNGSHVTMINHLLEIGILDDYLANNCESHNYKICNYKDSLPWDFMWDTKSPLYLTGGWEANRDEYHEIIIDVLSKPKYIKIFIQKSIEYGFVQFFHFKTGDIQPYTADSSPNQQIKWRYKYSEKEYLSSLQNRGLLDFTFLNERQYFTVFTSFLFIFIFLFNKNIFKSIQTKNKIFISLLMLFLFSNAFICSTFSGIFDRFQSRIIWLLPFLIIILINEHFNLKTMIHKNDNNTTT